MSKIFISYRREDSAYVVAMLRDRLRGIFGADSVFLDIDNIPLGVDFRDHIHRALTDCDIVLAVIGDRWEGQQIDGTRKIDDPSDYLRIELEYALTRGIPVIPILIDGARMPAHDQLPNSLQLLAFRQAAEIRPGRDMENHIAQLLARLPQLDAIRLNAQGAATDNTSAKVNSSNDCELASTTNISVDHAINDAMPDAMEPASNSNYVREESSPSYGIEAKSIQDVSSSHSAFETATELLESQVTDRQPTAGEATVLQGSPDGAEPVSQLASSSDDQIDLVPKKSDDTLEVLSQLMLLLSESGAYQQLPNFRAIYFAALKRLNELRLAYSAVNSAELQAEESRDQFHTMIIEVIQGLTDELTAFRDEAGRAMVRLWRTDSWARWREEVKCRKGFWNELHHILDVE